MRKSRKLDYRFKTVRAKTWSSARNKATKQCPKERTVVSVLKEPNVPKLKGMSSYVIGHRKKLK